MMMMMIIANMVLLKFSKGSEIYLKQKNGKGHLVYEAMIFCSKAAFLNAKFSKGKRAA